MNAKSTKTKKAAQKKRNDETPEKFIAAYKGFDKDFACRGFRYEVGKTYTMDGEPEVCERGFHACENPFDVLDHYAAFGDDGTPNRFAEVEVGGKMDEEKDDVGNVRKVAGTKIRVKAEISFAGLVKAGIAWIIEKTRPQKIEITTETNDGGKNVAKIGSSGYGAQIGSSGDGAQIGSSGYGAQIGSSGDVAKIGSSGDWAKIGSSGDGAQIGSSGDWAKIGSSGDWAQIGSSGDVAKIGSSGDGAKIGSSGDGAQIGSSGDWAKIGSSGDWAQIESTGENCVVMAAGRNCVAAAAKGSWITLAEWRVDNEKCRWVPVCVKTAFVDGEKIRAGVLYRLRNGEFEEVAR